MKELFRMGLLLDFYGQLLTPRQQEILDLYWNSDYSLAEIAEHLGISRQGVYDNIKRGRKTLERLENRLGLVEKFMEQRKKIQEVMGLLAGIDVSGVDGESRHILNRAVGVINEIINTV